MVAARKTVVRRYFKAKQGNDGAPIPGTEDEDMWIDVELLLSFITSSGQGSSYEQRNWVLDWGATSRTNRWTKIYKDEDNDPDTWVLVPIPDKAYFSSGEGPSYRRLAMAYDNGPENDLRTNAVMRVFHAEFGSKGKVDVDKDDYIDVAVVKKYVEDTGLGHEYRRDTYFLENGEVPLRNERLQENEYEVVEKPVGDTTKVWPSHREVAPE